jgi:hypothetical protein
MYESFKLDELYGGNMAVAVTGPAYGFDLAKMAGVKEHLLISAKDAGFSMEHNSGYLNVKDGSKQVLGSIPLKSTAITLMQQGKMGPSSKAAIQYQIEKALEKGLGVLVAKKPDPLYTPAKSWEKPVYEAHPDPVIEAIVAGAAKKKGFKFNVEKKYPASAKSAAQKAAWTKAQMKKLAEGESMSVTLLEEATGPEIIPPVGSMAILKEPPLSMHLAGHLYQPVKGTNKTYYLLAVLAGGVKLAARVSGEKASFRVEGSSLGAYETALKTVGFDYKGNYGSVHLDCSGPGVKKTYGAILGAIGFSNLTQVGDISVIMKAGL